jgi:methyl-accepting chemotaxis protein
MQWFHDLKLSTKLIGSFCTVLLLTALLGGFAALQLNRLADQADDIGQSWVPQLEALSVLQANMYKSYQLTQQAVFFSNNAQASQAQQIEQIESKLKTLADLQKEKMNFYASHLDEEDKVDWSHFLEKYAALMESQASSFKTIKDNLSDDARARSNAQRQQIFDDAMAPVQRLLRNEINGSSAAGDKAHATARAANLWIIVTVSTIVLLGMGLAVFTSRHITRPMLDAVNIAERVAEGDLNANIEVHSQDEIGQLLAAMRKMNHKLVDIVSQVRSSSDSIATGSNEIAIGNADLSRRTEQQAANLEKTAASMEELHSTVNNNADTARQATQLASAASSVALKGGDVMTQVVSTMEQIASSSRQISDIIGTIDGIAFQTNILALNAAVEAARAGEQGRGFAVVASEVRTLAQRSAEAAKQIRQLIGANVERVEDGSRLVTQAGTTMTDIVSQVQRVSDLIGEINAAATEQAAGIEQVNNAVLQLDEVTRQNAALVEESSAAAESLKQQASSLVDAVGIFQIDTAHTGISGLSGGGNPPQKAPKAHAPRQQLAASRKKAASTPSSFSPRLPAVAGAGGNSNAGWETF